MHGTNEVTNQFLRSDGRLLVNSTFLTIQGEGPDAGRVSVFVRLSKCNLRCWFCDTQFDEGDEWDPQDLANEVFNLSYRKTNHVTLTGGEPLLQNVVPFIKILNTAGWYVQIETAGTVFVPGLENLFDPKRLLSRNAIVISPKTPKLNEDTWKLCHALKYIISVDNFSLDDGLPSLSTQHWEDGKQTVKVQRLFRPDRWCDIFVQPMDEGNEEANRANMQATADVAMRYGYRVSFQMHKHLGVP